MILCRRDRSTSRRSWSSTPFGTRRGSRRGYRFGHRCRFSRRPSGSTKTKLQCQRGSPFRICRRDQSVIAGKVPPCSIRIDGQSMAGSEMASDHLAAPATFQANDIIAMDGSANRDGGYPLIPSSGCRLSESSERLMHGRDQRPELVGHDLVLPNISCDNCRSEFSIKYWGRRFIGHVGSPFVVPTEYHARLDRGGDSDGFSCPAPKFAYLCRAYLCRAYLRQRSLVPCF